MAETTAGRAAGCVHHPERAPLGRCAACRRPVCGECHIRIDGILHCRECLGATEDTLLRQRPSLAPRLVTAACALLVLAPALLLALGLLRVFGVAAGRLSRLGAVAFERAAAPDGDSGR